ncbi:MAG: hypothetical protein MUF58_07390 [Arcicella sp.]|jgi:hypothetical protein|nr:hypothetical protein [Arcicella sp.]
MRLDNNFKFKYDPFGLVDFNVQDARAILVPPEKPKSNWSWVWWLLLIVFLGIFIYLATKIYDKFTEEKETLKADESSSDELLNEEEIKSISENNNAESHKLLPEHKVIARYDLGDETNWDLVLLESKKAEGKAKFVKGYGWLLYE